MARTRTGRARSRRAAGRRHVCVITGTRAEYGLLRPVIAAFRSEGLVPRVIVTGMHLSPQFGLTVDQIVSDGCRIDARVEMTLAGDSAAAMATSIGVGICGLTQVLTQLAPDIVLLLGDRVEAFAGATSAACLNIPVGHLHGGEVSRGGLDESMRHAITKLAHLHFTATEQNRRRTIRMGERPDCVFTVGAPGLDDVMAMKIWSRTELEGKLGRKLPMPLVLVVQHPVSTTADDAAAQMRETLEAVRETSGCAVVVYPNADTGGRRMIEVIEGYRGEPWLYIKDSFDRQTYLSLLHECNVLVGNSSSGVIEAASYRTPVVNLGTRQAGRQRSTNIIDAPLRREDIREAIEKALGDRSFRARLRRCRNPYFTGNASRRIAEILARVEIGPALLQKQITY